MECCKASQFSNDAGARIWQAADVGYLALQYGAWLTWACLTLQLSSHLVPLLLQESSHLVPLLLQESSLHFLSFFTIVTARYGLRLGSTKRVSIELARGIDEDNCKTTSYGDAILKQTLQTFRW